MGGKKLSDLTRLGTLPNTVNVLVEDNGEAKRVPANKLGSGLTVPVGSPDTLTWDGNTEGLVSVAGAFYKVSDAVVTMDDLANGYTVCLAGEEVSIEAKEAAPGVIATVPEYVFLISDGGAGVDLGGIVFPEPGVYFMTAVEYYVTSLTIPGYTGFPVQEKIAPSYLYQPDWNQTDETAADFIKNKPFGEKTVMGGTLTWDGNTEGLVSVADFVYKVSDVVPTAADFAGGAVLGLFNGESYMTTQFSAEEILQPTEGILAIGDVYIISVANAEMDGAVFPETGTYFMSSDGMFISSLTIPGYTGFANTEIKQIDSKYLPDVADIPAAWIADLKAALGIA